MTAPRTRAGLGIRFWFTAQDGGLGVPKKGLAGEHEPKGSITGEDFKLKRVELQPWNIWEFGDLIGSWGWLEIPATGWLPSILPPPSRNAGWPSIRVKWEETFLSFLEP